MRLMPLRGLPLTLAAHFPIKLLTCSIMVLTALAISAASASFKDLHAHPKDEGKAGGPVTGITQSELEQFIVAHEAFGKDLKPEDGLGPLFNRRSCASCHGRGSGIDGGDGRELGSTTVARIGKLLLTSKLASGSYAAKVAEFVSSEDLDTLNNEGGPVLAVRSIAKEYGSLFPVGTKIPGARVPKDARYISFRHAPPLFGMGLVDALSDKTLLQVAQRQKDAHNGHAFGVPSKVKPVVEGGHSVGRFGLKAQHGSVFNFVAEAMHVELGMTTPMHPRAKSATGLGNFPKAISSRLPPDPNDDGHLLAKLTWFVENLAPPPRDAAAQKTVAGERLFNQVGCAECHVPELSTAAKVFMPSPVGSKIKVAFASGKQSPVSETPIESVSNIKMVEVHSLENKPVHAYSDFLLHDMGHKLADGIAQGTASGGQWRTQPLWGLRHRKFLLHDGRAKDISSAIGEHGGQAQDSVNKFNNLKEDQRLQLLKFLGSL